MNTNINNQLFARCCSILPLIALVATSIWPQYALAASDTIQPVGGLVFNTQQTIFDAPLSASYVFTKGAVLGVTTTAYSSTPQQTHGDPFITASGTRVRDGVAAANFLPIGTVIRLGGKRYIVEDRLNSRYNNSYRVDIWMESTETALRFGVQRMVLEVMSVP